MSQSNEEKPCRACVDFRSWMKKGFQSNKSEETSKDKGINKDTASSIQRFNIPVEDEYGGRGTRKHPSSQPNEPDTPAPSDDGEIHTWGLASKYGCPADSVTLGQGSWRLLHSMAAYYPEVPSEDVKKDMKNFIRLFSNFYPCKPCAEDFKEWLKEHPPDVSSQSSISKWFCVAHNEVNRKLSKPEFDCSVVNQRWIDGWKDGSCD